MNSPASTLQVQHLFDVRGRVALITGGSSGVGQMIATALVANGARTYITGRNPERLAAAAAQLNALGSCIPLQASLGSMADVEALAQQLQARETRLDILVNNAGASWTAPIETFPESGWDKVYNTNVKLPFFLAQRLLPLLSAPGPAEGDDSARIINISSVAARLGEAVSPPYNSSKAAVENLTAVMARSLGPHRITVNAIAPGWFPSRMNAPLGDAAAKAWIDATPAGRLGTMEDMGGLALFLCSRAGAFINGQTITTDGGRML